MMAHNSDSVAFLLWFSLFTKSALHRAFSRPALGGCGGTALLRPHNEDHTCHSGGLSSRAQAFEVPAGTMSLLCRELGESVITTQVACVHSHALGLPWGSSAGHDKPGQGAVLQARKPWSHRGEVRERLFLLSKGCRIPVMTRK